MADETRNTTETSAHDDAGARRRDPAGLPRHERTRDDAYDEQYDDYHREHVLPAAIRRVSWGAILAGAVIALMTQLALNLLGASIGFGSIDPTAEAYPFSGLGTGTIVWLVVSTIVALFTGGYVASRLAGMPDRTDGILHGVAAWSVVTIFTFYLMTSAAGRVLNTATSIVGQGLQLAGQGVSTVASGTQQQVQQQLQQEGVSLNALVTDLIDELQQSITGPPGTQQGDEDAIRQAINQLTTPGNDAADRQSLVNVITTRTELSQSEATQTVQQFERQLQQVNLQRIGQQAGETAEQVGGTVAATLSRAAFWAFISMLIGVIAAAIGGAVGVPRDLPASPAVRRE